MSAERLVRRALWRLVFWHLVGDIVSIPRRIFEMLAHIGSEFEAAVFYFELDAARRYEGLTSVDLGKAAGQAERYEGLSG